MVVGGGWTLHDILSAMGVVLVIRSVVPLLESVAFVLSGEEVKSKGGDTVAAVVMPNSLL